MTDTTTPEPSPWEKKLAQEKRRQERRDRNERLFTAVMHALDPKSKFPQPTLDARLDAVRAAIASGGDVNARATLVDHLKERPLGMVAHHIASDAAVPVMQILMEQGADPALLDKEGNTFSHTLVARAWRHRHQPALSDHLRAWFAQAGSNHLSVANTAQQTPLSLALFGLDRMAFQDADGASSPMLVQAMVDAGARVEDLPPHTLFALLEQNRRAGFDLAVALGADPHERRGSTNLWSAWAATDHNRTSFNRDTDRQAWMERLIELEVDPMRASGPASHTPDRGDSSALMLLLSTTLSQPAVDEVCLARLKDLGCPTQSSGQYPLHNLAAAAKVEHLEALHRLGFDLAGARNDRNETLLHAIAQADLRHMMRYQGENRTAQDTVKVLLAAGCPPGGLNTPKDKDELARSPLAMTVLNVRNGGQMAESFDRVEMVERLIAAGASINESEPARHLIGHLFYGQAFSAKDVSWNNQSAFGWQTLHLSSEDEDLTFLLREHGAQLPEVVVPNGMPFLLGVAPSAYGYQKEQEQRPELWKRLVERETSGWADRFALETLKWIGRGERHTNLKHDRCVALVEWCVAQGVDETTWGAAARAANYQPSHPMTQHIERMELRAAIRELPEDPALGATRPRARL